MAGIVGQLRDWWGSRKAMQRVEAALKKNDPAALAEVLAESAELEERVAGRAEEMVQQGDLWNPLVICLALTRNASAHAGSVLRLLLDAPQRNTAFRALEQEEAGQLAMLAAQSAQTDDFETLLACYDDQQLAAAQPAAGDPLSLAWLRLAVQRDPLWPAVYDELARLGERAKEFLQQCWQRVHDQLQQELQVDAYDPAPLGNLARRLNVLAAISGQTPKVDVLRHLVQRLSRFPLPAITATAELLERAPAEEWVQPLRDVWSGQLHDPVWLDADRDPNVPLDPELESAAYRVAVALGARAPCAGSLQDFRNDEALTDEADAVADELDALLEEREILEEQEDDASQRKEIDRRITDLQDHLKKWYRSTQVHFSSGYLLLRVLNDEQHYGAGVRQGVARGLFVLLQKGGLTPEARQEVETSLSQARQQPKFRERRVLIPEASTITEMTLALREALGWMTEVLGDSEGLGLAPYADLEATVRLLHERIPGAMAFLRLFPLRLLTLDDHKRILSVHLRNGCSLDFATHYTPPWEAGKVHKRLLYLQDRTAPNALGIPYKLLRHPLLALPIIYHESLRHVGVPENELQGISNETALLLRSSLFLRRLFAELAPAEDKALVSYEEEFVRLLRQTGMESLLYLMLADFEDNETLAQLNQEVLETYGPELGLTEGLAKAEEVIAEWNERIRRENDRLVWDPKVRWPELDTKATKELTEALRRLLSDRWARNHQITPVERETIWQEADSQQAREAWEEYSGRPDALERLWAAWDEFGFSEETIRQLLVRRFAEGCGG
jgi:hypothetical protein